MACSILLSMATTLAPEELQRERGTPLTFAKSANHNILNTAAAEKFTLDKHSV